MQFKSLCQVVASVAIVGEVVYASGSGCCTNTFRSFVSVRMTDVEQAIDRVGKALGPYCAGSGSDISDLTCQTRNSIMKDLSSADGDLQAVIDEFVETFSVRKPVRCLSEQSSCDCNEFRGLLTSINKGLGVFNQKYWPVFITGSSDPAKCQNLALLIVGLLSDIQCSVKQLYNDVQSCKCAGGSSGSTILYAILERLQELVSENCRCSRVN